MAIPSCGCVLADESELAGVGGVDRDTDVITYANALLLARIPDIVTGNGAKGKESSEH